MKEKVVTGVARQGWDLHDAVAEATSRSGSSGGARIVAVSSSGHGASPVIFEDINFERREYDPSLAYGQSKTANALFAVGVSRRWGSEGILSNSLMPGGIWTPLQRHWSEEQRATGEEQARQAEEAGLFRMKTPEQGAATSVLLAASPLVEGIGGRYFEDCNEAEVVLEIVDGVRGVRDYALDPTPLTGSGKYPCACSVSEQILWAQNRGPRQRHNLGKALRWRELRQRGDDQVVTA